MPTTTIDFAPLASPVPADQVRAWKAQAKAEGRPWASWQTGQWIGLLMFVPIGILMLGVAGSMLTVLTRVSNEEGLGLGALPVVFLLVVLGIVGFGVVKGLLDTNGRWELWARMDRFARANGMRFSPRDDNPAYPGAIFGIGRGRQAVDHLQNASGRFFDLGTYTYTTGSGKSRRTHTWGFLAFHLDRRLPHMVLDSKANNGLFGGTNLPATFDKSQILSLEGDFDRYFTLYCPKQYERDALYVFTPDLMALLIDEAAPFDVEIVDDWMFVYSSTPFRTGDAGIYARLFRILDTVGAKTLTQTDRYVDERVGDFTANIVAPQGARLKRSVSVGAIVIGAVFVALWLWGVLGDVAGG
jgi:hypothetical protein